VVAAVSANTERCTGAQPLRVAGDRAVISAPQGFDYIVAFSCAMQAGQIAVPLSVPLGGITDERVNSVLHDASPSVILTTSAVAGNIASTLSRQSGASLHRLEVDVLDLDARQDPVPGRGLPEYRVFAVHVRVNPSAGGGHDVAQKRSGHFEQVTSDYLRTAEKFPRQKPYCVVAALLSRHGFVSGSLRANSDGTSRWCSTSPVAFLQGRRWMQLLASNSKAYSAAPLRVRNSGEKNRR